MNGGIEFDWDAENTRHLKRHRVTPDEFEELLNGDPLYLEYQSEKVKSAIRFLGATQAGRVLIAVWTPRHGKVRAVTVYNAGRTYQKLYWGSRG